MEMANDKIFASEKELENIPALKDVSDDVIVHCNIRSNAELIARILDHDIENVAYNVAYLDEAQWIECYPANNSLIETTEDITWMCSWCKNKEEQKTNFCPNCGKKMR